MTTVLLLQITLLVGVTADLLRRVCPEAVPFLVRVTTPLDPDPNSKLTVELAAFDGTTSTLVVRGAPEGRSRLRDLSLSVVTLDGQEPLGDAPLWAAPGEAGTIELRFAFTGVSWTRTELRVPDGVTYEFSAPMQFLGRQRCVGMPANHFGLFASLDTLRVESGPGHADLVRHLGGAK